MDELGIRTLGEKGRGFLPSRIGRVATLPSFIGGSNIVGSNLVDTFLVFLSQNIT